MARRTYDIADDQHGKLKRLAGLFNTTQAKFLAYLIDAEWQRTLDSFLKQQSIMDCPNLDENHEKTE